MIKKKKKRSYRCLIPCLIIYWADILDTCRNFHNFQRGFKRKNLNVCALEQVRPIHRQACYRPTGLLPVLLNLLLKWLVHSSVTEELMGFDDQCWDTTDFHRSLTSEPGREFYYLQIQFPPQPISLPTHKNETCTWLKLGQILGLLVSAHATFCLCKFCPWSLGTVFPPRTAPQGHSLAFHAGPGMNLHPCSEHSSSTGTRNLKGLENIAQTYWDEHGELGSDAWVMLAVEFLLGFLGRNALTPHHESGFRVAVHEEDPNFAINCCFYHYNTQLNMVPVWQGCVF